MGPPAGPTENEVVAEVAKAQPWPFSPATLDGRCCLARTWNGGLGGQCRRLRAAGVDFCTAHATSDKWRAHGRVDGPVPELKLREFEAAAQRIRLPSLSPPRARRVKRSAPFADSKTPMLETPPKVARRSADHEDVEVTEKKPIVEVSASLERVIERCPGVAGRIAEYIFATSVVDQVLPSGHIIRKQGVSPELGELLLSARTLRLNLVVGIKEHRLMVVGLNEHYPGMCTLVEKVCKQAWAESRGIRMGDTGDADVAFILNRWKNAEREE